MKMCVHSKSMLWVWCLSVSDADLHSSVCVLELAGAGDSKPCSFSTILEEELWLKSQLKRVHRHWALLKEARYLFFSPQKK